MNATFKRAVPGEPVSLDDVVAPTVIESMHALRVAITVFDSDERLIFANEHFNYMFRALPRRDELVGQRYEDVMRLELSGGDIAEGQTRKNLDELIATRRASLFHSDYAPRDIPLADGRIIEVKTRRTPQAGWIILWTDVTAARHTMDRLNAAITLSADAFAFYDRYDRLTLCNEEYARLTGATAAEIKGGSFNEVVERIAEYAIAPNERASWIERRHENHRIPAGAMTVEMREGTAYLMRDRASSDGGRIVVFTDVTDHRRVEKALIEQSAALADTRQALEDTKAHSEKQANYLADLATKLDQTAAAADTTKKTLLRTMSHELKTPLNAIIGFSDLLGTLADVATPEQIREYAGLIHIGGNNLLKLLNQILDLTKISAGKFEPIRQPIDAGMSLWNIKDRFDGDAHHKAIDLVIEQGEAGLMVEADETAYTTILSQLVDNAVRFTQNGGTVRLSAEATETGLRLTIADNGPGVPEEDLVRILEPFEQGGRTTIDHSDGAGLGLTLAKAYCELHGGTLTVKSAPGQGFTAIVDLPVQK